MHKKYRPHLYRNTARAAPHNNGHKTVSHMKWYYMYYGVPGMYFRQNSEWEGGGGSFHPMVRDVVLDVLDVTCDVKIGATTHREDDVAPHTHSLILRIIATVNDQSINQSGVYLHSNAVYKYIYNMYSITTPYKIVV